MKKTVCLVVLLSAGCCTVPATGEGRVHHIVLCGLKEPGNAGHRRRIVEASRSFAEIPAVLSVRAGEVLESDRPVVDDGFDVAVVLSFENAKDLQDDLVHPDPTKAKKEVPAPLVKKLVVYDFAE